MFIENVGQFNQGARFQARGGNRAVWLATDAIWVAVLEPLATSSRQSTHPQDIPETSPVENRRGVNLKLSVVGANLQPRLEPFNRLDTHISYFTGSDSAKWRADVPVWGGVRYKDLYPGIDLEVTVKEKAYSCLPRRLIVPFNLPLTNLLPPVSSNWRWIAPRRTALTSRSSKPESAPGSRHCNSTWG
jgi:hypothetical protein